MKTATPTKFKETDTGTIPEGWDVVKVADITEKVAIGPFGSSIKVETFVSEGMPVISGQHLHGTRLEDGDYNFVTLDHAEKLRNSIVFRGDVIFTHAGNIGQVAYIPSTSKYDRYIISQRQFYLRCNKEKLTPEFITYFFKAPVGQHLLLSNKSQTGVPSIAQPVSHLRKIDVLLPPLNEQKQISDILSAIDDKIELNRQINANLEELASSIFKEWFLDSELSKRGRVGSVTEICEFNPRYSLQKGKSFRYVEMKDLPEVGLSIKTPIQRDFKSGSKFTNNDTLLARITPCLENGKTGFVDFLNKNEIAWGSTEFIVMHPIEREFTEFLYILARSENFREHAIQSMSGTSGRQRVQVNSLADYKLTIPSKDVISEYHRIAESLFVQIRLNNDQSNNLIEIKNSLLPRLMSGKIRVGTT